MNGLLQLETELRNAVAEVRWLSRVLNAADRVAGVTGELPYAEPEGGGPLDGAADHDDESAGRLNSL